MIVNARPILYVPLRLRSKAPADAGRRYVLWCAEVAGYRWPVGPTAGLLAHGRDRQRDTFRHLGGDWQPGRRFQYWSRTSAISNGAK